MLKVQNAFLIRKNKPFDDEDLLLAEYAATIIGVEILHERAAKVEEEVRKKAMVQIAFSTLSYSELEAIVNILGELKGMEGLLVASKIADRVGITRSVIVNALRKFESAGLIETKSLGMKGTYIRIKNEFLLEELRNVAVNRSFLVSFKVSKQDIVKKNYRNYLILCNHCASIVKIFQRRREFYNAYRQICKRRFNF